ncbi:MAG: ABC transporter ATP-binding protein, partial [archaeon]|nr:ABC transporter ATP-binding protein [archaeon]
MRIDVEDVSFSYPGGKKVLRDIALSISEPGLICIIGPNGVGKSTLIRCINKIIKVTSGKVLLDGKDVRGMSYKEISEHMGYVPVASEDSFPMTVFDTVMIGRTPKKQWTPGRSDYDAVYDVLEMVGVEDLAMRPFNELSAGQHQKVAIARGLAQEPEVLILDEPTSNLDVKHQVNVIKLLKRLSEEKKMTSLMVSHDLNITARYADRIILMAEPGVIKQIGTPEEVIT